MSPGGRIFCVVSSFVSSVDDPVGIGIFLDENTTAMKSVCVMHKMETSRPRMQAGAGDRARPSFVLSVLTFLCVLGSATSSFGGRHLGSTVESDLYDRVSFDLIRDIRRAHVTSPSTVPDRPQVSRETSAGVVATPEGGLLVEENVRVSYNMFVPSESRLWVSLAPIRGQFSQLEIRVETDDGVFIDWVHDAHDGELRIPLSALSHEAATISFTALIGDVQLKGARIVQHRGVGSEPAPVATVKNVMVFVVDTLRRDRLLTYNPSTKVYAPGLRRLAEQSVVFDNAVAQSNWTKPSTATLLTGVYPSTHSANTHNAVLPETISTLPVILRDQGFATGGFVANGYISPKFGFGRGWDHFEAFDTKQDPSQGRRMFPALLRWVKSRPKDQRYFAYVHTTDVHAPYRSPRYVWSRYDSARYSGAIRPAETAGVLNRVRAGSFFLAKRDLFRLTALYDGAVSYHDQSIEKLMRDLKELGVLDDTLVILTSDHGEEFLDHGSVGHGHTLHEELLNVPLFVRFPRRAGIAPRHVSDVVGLIDIVPTLGDVLRVDIPGEVQGISLFPVVRGFEVERADGVVISESPSHHSFALQNERFKAIITKGGTTLYDKSERPSESVDRTRRFPIAKSAIEDILEEHNRRVAAWRDRFLSMDAVVGADKGADIDGDTEAQLRALGYMGD